LNDFLDLDIKSVKGVGEKTAKLFSKIGVNTVGDLLYYFPRRIEDRTNFKKIKEVFDRETVCIKATVFSDISSNIVRKGLIIHTAILKDDTGIINAVWYNNSYVKTSLKKGKEYIFYGQVTHKFNKWEIQSPIWEEVGKNLYLGRLLPVYQLTKSLNQKTIQKAVLEVLPYADKITDTMPSEIKAKYNLAQLSFALKNIHFPKDIKSYEIARRRLVFEELLVLILGLMLLKGRKLKEKGPKFTNFSVSHFTNSLSFKLTGAQERVINEIIEDFKKDVPMGRLIQGDVGCGKTVVAAAALYIAVINGYQGTMMAPTEILANQHYESFKKLFEPFNISVGLLSGSLTKKAKNEIYEKTKNGEIDILIGTHALIEEGVTFKNLGIAITDEQHRFGVLQRAKLNSKGENPHILVMTATPIPRSLALIIYGDLDISIIDELPPGRQKVSTYVVDDSYRNRVYNFIKKEIEQGRQAYIVCPLVEENEELELKSVLEFFKDLKENVFPNIEISYLHGKMKAAQKDKIMKDFVEGKSKVLVSTTVIEVGVNVPNATVMVVENAERFGLSQLHQLRGRVGRGKYKSYCILFSESGNKTTQERLDIMQKTNDGFKISEKDLELRGPGEFFGQKQHGLPSLKIANLLSDLKTLKEAKEAAFQILKEGFSKNEYFYLQKQIKNLFDNESFSF